MATAVAGVPSPWSDKDISAAAFRCASLGASERATDALLDRLAARGVRRLRPYLDGISDRDLANQLGDAETVLTATTGRDVWQRPRRPRRWPWRTSSGHAHPLT